MKSLRRSATRPPSALELAEVLDGGGEEKLAFRSVGTSHAQAVELQNAFEVSKQHLDLLALASGRRIRVGQRQIAGHIPRAFMDWAPCGRVGRDSNAT
jgi:hypothetical protein